MAHGSGLTRICLARSAYNYTGEELYPLAPNIAQKRNLGVCVGNSIVGLSGLLIILLLAIIVHSSTLDSNFMIMKYGSYVLLAVSKGDSLYNASVYAKRFIEEVIYLIGDGSIKNSYKTTYGEFCDLELSEIHYI